MANKQAKIIFSHSNLSDLMIDVNPDSIVWSYGLNTQNYSTFGGEVVQILSMFIEDMTISGTVSSYKKMEVIYKWFAAYMQMATQGHGSSAVAYDTSPVTFEYPARGWKFLIQPKEAPGFKYGKNVVAPNWTIKAAVVESPESFNDLIKTKAQAEADDPSFQPFGTATAEIGFNEFNPWVTPNTGKDYKKGATKKYYAELSGANGPYNSFIKSWLKGSSGAFAAEALGANWSKPTFGAAFEDTGSGKNGDGKAPSESNS